MSQAMLAASKLIPASYTTIDSLRPLTHVDMARLGIADEEVRKGIMALNGRGKAGGTGKRKRGSDLDRPLGKEKEVVKTDFEFEEIEWEETLMRKSVVVNRSPVMMAWATVVAERLGFKRQEALSIAQCYTDLNASSKGVSLGILPPSANHASAGTSQPYVDLMGRQVPVLTMQDGEWRGITKGGVAEPSTAFSYLQRAFRQQLGAVIGALRLLAASYDTTELNKIGFGLYADFRPDSEAGPKGWGQKSEMKLSAVLALRKVVKEDEEAEVEAEIEDGRTGDGELEIEVKEELVDGDREEEEGLEKARKKVKLEDEDG
ncbi:hypothetical protein P7C70_g9521, partial [Phenoliferia sp. Uapishka_3]